MGHIPPTVGSYRQAQFWHTIYLDKYRELIHEYKDIVVAQLFGHLHSDEFRVLSKPSPDGLYEDLPPLLITPALSPVFGDLNPSFRVVTFDRSDYTILDYETRFIDIQDGASLSSQWQALPSFRKAYGVPDLSARSLKKVATEISTVSGVLETFLSRRHVNNNTETCTTDCRIEWKCILKSSSRQEFDDCVNGFNEKSEKPTMGSHVVFIVSMIFAFVFTLCTVRCFYVRSNQDSNSGSIGLVEDDSSTSTDRNNIGEQTSIPEIS